jgi:hypothetical protein
MGRGRGGEGRGKWKICKMLKKDDVIPLEGNMRKFRKN